jgi:hypothetical protein
MSEILSNLISTTSKFEKNYKRLINLLSNIIGNTIEKSVKYEQKLSQIELNKSFEEPKISITKYIRRLIKHANPEPSTLILAVIYFDRICNNGKINLCYSNVYKLILISLVLAIKYNEEYFESNEFYGKVGGLTIKSINKLEIYTLKVLKFNLYVKEEIYETYVNQFSAFLEANKILL